MDTHLKHTYQGNQSETLHRSIASIPNPVSATPGPAHRARWSKSNDLLNPLRGDILLVTVGSSRGSLLNTPTRSPSDPFFLLPLAPSHVDPARLPRARGAAHPNFTTGVADGSFLAAALPRDWGCACPQTRPDPVSLRRPWIGSWRRASWGREGKGSRRPKQAQHWRRGQPPRIGSVWTKLDPHCHTRAHNSHGRGRPRIAAGGGGRHHNAQQQSRSGTGRGDWIPGVNNQAPQRISGRSHMDPRQQHHHWRQQEQERGAGAGRASWAGLDGATAGAA